MERLKDDFKQKKYVFEYEIIEILIVQIELDKIVEDFRKVY